VASARNISLYLFLAAHFSAFFGQSAKPNRSRTDEKALRAVVFHGAFDLPLRFAPRQVRNDMSKIYVGNLPVTATSDTVRALFTQHGVVDSVALITDRQTGRPRWLLRSSEERIRIWERLRELRLPRTFGQVLVKVIAWQTRLAIGQVHEEHGGALQ
jgi:hypothetical protein